MAHTFDRARPAYSVLRTANPLVGLMGRLSAWNDARRTRNALAQLSSHELDDIGLSRGDIDNIGRPF